MKIKTQFQIYTLLLLLLYKNKYYMWITWYAA